MTEPPVIGLRFSVSRFRVQGSGFSGGHRLEEGSERGATRAEDAQETPTQSHISPSILVYEGYHVGVPPHDREVEGGGEVVRQQVHVPTVYLHTAGRYHIGVPAHDSEVEGGREVVRQQVHVRAQIHERARRGRGPCLARLQDRPY